MPATNFPAEPNVSDDQRGAGVVALRYEDVAQDGRVAIGAIPQAIGAAVWRAVLARHPAHALMRERGVLPILTRLVVLGGDGSCSVDEPLDATGCYEPAASVDTRGEVDRLYLNMWASLEGPRARTFDAAPRGNRERHVVGRVFGEHVFTRPFGPPAERKITRLTLPGLPEVPEPRYAPRPLHAVLTPPPNTTALDAEPLADSVPLVLGLAHTDSNQHVNSLVYPRLFEEAVLRRLSQHGVTRPLLAREVELLYRKPSFAGEAVRVVLRTFRDGARYFATGTFLAEGDLLSPESLAAARPRCAVRMLLA
jgi:hypothetical protein